MRFARATVRPTGWCLNLQNDCCGVRTESGSDRVTILAISILAISGDPVATALGTDLILKLRHHRSDHPLALRPNLFDTSGVNLFRLLRRLVELFHPRAQIENSNQMNIL